MPIVTDPKTKKKKWKPDVDVPGSPGWEAEQDKRKRQMEEDRKRTLAIREPGAAKAGIEEKAATLLEERQPEIPQVFQQPTPQEILQPQIEQVQVPIEEPKEVSKGFFKKLVSGEFTDIGKKFEEETGQKVVMGTVPIGGVPVPSTSIVTAATKAKIYSAMASKVAKYGALLFGVRTVANIPEKRITDDLAEMRIMKTDLGRTMLKNINLGPEFALMVLDDLDIMDAALNKYEREIKKEDVRSYTSRFFGYGKFGETQAYIESLRNAIFPIRQLAARAAVGGDVSDEVAVALAAMEMEIAGESNE